jgi:hypothetical protein
MQTGLVRMLFPVAMGAVSLACIGGKGTSSPIDSMRGDLQITVAGLPDPSVVRGYTIFGGGLESDEHAAARLLRREPG